MSDLLGRAFAMTVRRVVRDKFFSTVGAAETTTIRDLRVRFSIEKNLGSEPNKCDVSVYNLSEANRKAFEIRPVQVRIEAGYVDALDLLFRGDLRYGMSYRDDVDWVTKMQLGDGDRAYCEAQLSRTYAAGTSFGEVILDLATTMELVVDPRVLRALGKVVIQHSMSVHGPARRSMDQIVKALAANALAGLRGGIAVGQAILGLDDASPATATERSHSWSVQDGQLQILGAGQGRLTQDRAWVVEQGNGMIGSPEFGTPLRKGGAPPLTVKHLLMPRVLPGDLVQVRARAVPDGIFRVTVVKHEGDTFGDDWTTTLEMKPR